jgi:hypothetical protein
MFIVKYSMDCQKELVKHVDGGDVSFMIALSNKTDYEGGGTKFEGVDDKVECDVGEVVIFPAETYHTGLEITAGTRYLLVGFTCLCKSALRVQGSVSLSLDELVGVESRFDVFDVGSTATVTTADVSAPTTDVSLERLRTDVAQRLAENKTYYLKLPISENAGAPLERFLAAVASHHADRLSLKQVAGVEFWYSTSVDGIEFHYDKDEALLKRSDVMVTPTLGTVTYFTTGGAPTVVFGEEETLVSYPVSGRHLTFSGKLLHGVPDVMARDDESSKQRRKKKRRKKERFVLLVNLWKKDPVQDDMAALPRPARDTTKEDDGADNDNDNDNGVTFEYARFVEISAPAAATVYSSPIADNASSAIIDNFAINPDDFVTSTLLGMKKKGAFEEDTENTAFVIVRGDGET